MDISSRRVVEIGHVLRGPAVVFTNGCFDLLHHGHVRLLEEASKLGPFLVVGLNSDASVRRLKGPTRPIMSQEVRAYMLASLRFVAQVVVFDEDTPTELCRVVRPKVIVKGSDWRCKTVAGAEFAERVHFVDNLADISTTKLVAEIQEQKRHLFKVGKHLIVATSAMVAESMSFGTATLIDPSEPVGLLRPCGDSMKVTVLTAAEWCRQEPMGIIGEVDASQET